MNRITGTKHAIPQYDKWRCTHLNYRQYSHFRLTSSPPTTTTKLRHSRKMANEEQDEATSLYISFMMSMLIAQTRCTTAHSPSRCLFLSDGGDNNSNIVSFDFRSTTPGKTLEYAQNAQSNPQRASPSTSTLGVLLD